MKIIYSKHLPPKGYKAINLFGVLFVRIGSSPMTEDNFNHEKIHTEQGRELLWLFFYLWYGVEYLIRYFQYGKWKEAYYNISFEREAYGNAANLNYIKKRKRYSFVKYLKKKPQ